MVRRGKTEEGLPPGIVKIWKKTNWDMLQSCAQRDPSRSRTRLIERINRLHIGNDIHLAIFSHKINKVSCQRFIYCTPGKAARFLQSPDGQILQRKWLSFIKDRKKKQRNEKKQTSKKNEKSSEQNDGKKEERNKNSVKEKSNSEDKNSISNSDKSAENKNAKNKNKNSGKRKTDESSSSNSKKPNDKVTKEKSLGSKAENENAKNKNSRNGKTCESSLLDAEDRNSKDKQVNERVFQSSVESGKDITSKSKSFQCNEKVCECSVINTENNMKKISQEKEKYCGSAVSNSNSKSTEDHPNPSHLNSCRCIKADTKNVNSRSNQATVKSCENSTENIENTNSISIQDNSNSCEMSTSNITNTDSNSNLVHVKCECSSSNTEKIMNSESNIEQTGCENKESHGTSSGDKNNKTDPSCENSQKSSKNSRKTYYHISEKTGLPSNIEKIWGKTNWELLKLKIFHDASKAKKTLIDRINKLHAAHNEHILVLYCKINLMASRIDFYCTPGIAAEFLKGQDGQMAQAKWIMDMKFKQKDDVDRESDKDNDAVEDKETEDSERSLYLKGIPLIKKKKQTIPVSIDKQEILLMLRAYQEHPDSWEALIIEMLENVNHLSDEARKRYKSSSTLWLANRVSGKICNLLSQKEPIKDPDIRKMSKTHAQRQKEYPERKKLEPGSFKQLVGVRK